MDESADRYERGHGEAALDDELHRFEQHPAQHDDDGGPETEQDNQKLFTLYNAVYSLASLAKLAQSSTATAGQLAGYNQRLQTGLQQVESYISGTTFNNFTLSRDADRHGDQHGADSVRQFRL